MYNACEWGNYCRVQDTGAGSRQLGRRAIVTYAALVVRPDSPVFTPQQLANRTVGVPFYFGTHYLALHMLEGFLPRDQIKLCRAPNGSRYRLDALMKGEIEATTLTEPYVTLAEKKGCRHRSARRSSTAPKSPPTGSMPRPTPPSTARCARRCAASTPTSAPICTTSSTITSEGPEIAALTVARPAREPSRGLRSRADPARRDAAHLRLAQELGHAGGDRVAASARQHGRAAPAHAPAE